MIIIIKQLAEEFEKQFTCLGENNEKHIIFTVSLEKEVTWIDENGEEITKIISYILQYIHGEIRFISCSLSNLVNSLSEGAHKTKCK